VSIRDDQCDCLAIHERDVPRFIRPFIDLIITIRIVMPVLVLLVTATVCFLMVGQMIDLFRGLIDDNGLLQQIFFQVTAFCWAGQTWYAARTLLNFSDIRYFNRERSLLFQVWLPRITGILVYLIIIAASIRAAYTMLDSLLNVSIQTGGVLLYFIIVMFRRNIMSHLYSGEHSFIKQVFILPLRQKGYTFSGHPRWFRRYYKWLFVSLYVYTLFLTYFVFAPIVIPQMLGTLTIVFGTFAVVTSVVTLAVYYSKLRIIPVISTTVVLLIVFGFINNNHGLRLYRNNKEWAAIRSSDVPETVTYYHNWLKQRKQSNPGFPVFFISLEGGGMRAAYWAAMLLAQMEDRYPGFSNHVFAFSGVSGGALGGSVFTRLIAAGMELDSNPGYAWYSHRTAEILSTDHLSPVMGSLLYPDFAQRLIPFPVSLVDRAKTLEKTSEKAIRSSLKPYAMDIDVSEIPFYDLWYGNQSKTYRIPAMFLNSTGVQDGKRYIFSNVNCQQYLVDAHDMNVIIGDYMHRVPFSTAVFTSCRFPIITPSARVYRNPDRQVIQNFPGNVITDLVDGGYFEFSGAATLIDILLGLNSDISSDPELQSIHVKLDPQFFILCVNNEKEKVFQPNMPPVGDYTQPIQALYTAMAARTPYSQAMAKKLVGDSAFNKRAVIQINMNIDEDLVPLGWYLSNESRGMVDDYIDYLFRASEGMVDDDSTPGSVIDSKWKPDPQTITDMSFLISLLSTSVTILE
jgi:hypothetical protein